MINQESITRALEELGVKCRDGINLYTLAIGKTENPRLRAAFTNIMQVHADLVSDLEQYISNRGGTPPPEGSSLSGLGQMIYARLAGVFSLDEDSVMIEALEETERAIIHAIDEALKLLPGHALSVDLFKRKNMFRGAFLRLRFLRQSLATS